MSLIGVLGKLAPKRSLKLCKLGQINDAQVYLKLSYNWRQENLGERHQDTMLVFALLSSFGEYDDVINLDLSSV